MSAFQESIVVDMIVKASLVLGLTALAAAALRRASAAARHLVWTLGLMGALAAPALSLALPRWELPLVRIASPAPAAEAVPAAAIPDIAAPRRHRSPTPTARPETSSPTQVVTAAGQTPISWRTLALIAWTIGALAIVGRVLLGLAAVQWMSRRTGLVSDAPWLTLAREMASQLGLRGVRFLRSGAASMPMAWGIVRPSVLMPADADTWPDDRLRIVLLHELAHVKRRDCLTHLFAQIACAAHWFNPLAWMAVRRLRAERERACDDLVLAAGTRGSDYADQLLEIARVMHAGRFPAVLAGASLAMAHRSQLEGRLIAILDPSVPRRGLTRLRAAMATAVFAIVLVPIASVQPWAEERAAVKADETMTTPASPAQTQEPAVPREAPAPQPQPTPAPAAQPQAPAQPDQPEGRGRREGLASVDADGMIQSVTQGVVQGTVQGMKGGIAGGIAGGVAGSVAGGIAGGVVGGVAGGVAHGVGTSVADTVADVAAHVMDAQDDSGKAQGSTMDSRTVNALIEALKDSDKEVRETALSALSRIRDPRVFEPLSTALHDSSPSVREQAAFALGQLRDARAVDPLTAALKDQNADVREQAAFALGQLRARSAVAALGAALKDADADVREQAVFALGQIRDASAIDAIGPALHDANASVREQAAFALGQIRDRRAVEPLISVLKDEKPDVREQAAFALGQLRDPRAVEALVIALKDANADVREQAAFALGQIRDARAIDGLTNALKDANASVRQQAAFALGQIR
jgi:HEAT repeat protein/beta-lactamase regulating signal transducer with metallopeptidase domain